MQSPSSCTHGNGCSVDAIFDVFAIFIIRKLSVFKGEERSKKK